MAPRSRPKAHHKVPRFYLEGFTDPERGTGKAARLWVYRFGEERPRLSRPAKTAFETHFNSFILPNGEHDPTIEEHLAVFDGESAQLWPSVSDETDLLSQETKATIAYYLGYQITRTSNMRRFMDDVYDQMNRMTLRLLAAKFDDLSTELRRRLPPKQTMIEAAEEAGLFSLHQNEQLASVYSGVPRVAETLFKMRWSIFHARGDNYFITSDNPVARANPQDSRHWVQADLTLPGVDVSFPVDAHCCLVLTWDGPEQRMAAADVVVQTINTRTLMWADNEIYSPQDDPRWRAAMVASTTESPSVET